MGRCICCVGFSSVWANAQIDALPQMIAVVSGHQMPDLNMKAIVQG
jgi:hypothetical protein